MLSLIPDVRGVIVDITDVFDVLAAAKAPQRCRSAEAGLSFAAALAGERVWAIQTALDRIPDALCRSAAAVRCIPRRVKHESDGTHPNVFVPL